MIHFCPEPLLQFLLPLLELTHFLVAIQKSENAHHSRKSMNLQHIQEFERLELEAIAAIDSEQHKISYFGAVQHRVDVICTFDELKPAPLTRNHCDRSFHCGDGVASIMFDQRANQSGFASLYK